MIDLKVSTSPFNLLLLAVGSVILGLLVENVRHRWQKQRRNEALNGPVSRRAASRDPRVMATSLNSEEDAEQWTVRRVEPSIDGHTSAEFSYAQTTPSFTAPSTTPSLSDSNQENSSEVAAMDASAGKIETINPKFLVVFVMSQPKAPFIGYELLQTILATRFRYGSNGYFHRYSNDEGEGPVLFSLSSLDAQGTFNLDQMGATQCTGLCLFMQLDVPKGNQARLNMMLEAAHQLSEELGGKLLDEQRKPLDRDSFIRYVQRIRQFEQQMQFQSAEDCVS